MVQRATTLGANDISRLILASSIRANSVRAKGHRVNQVRETFASSRRKGINFFEEGRIPRKLRSIGVLLVELEESSNDVAQNCLKVKLSLLFVVPRGDLR